MISQPEAVAKVIKHRPRPSAKPPRIRRCLQEAANERAGVRVGASRASALTAPDRGGYLGASNRPLRRTTERNLKWTIC
jgi:hypothetical protein